MLWKHGIRMHNVFLLGLRTMNTVRINWLCMWVVCVMFYLHQCVLVAPFDILGSFLKPEEILLNRVQPIDACIGMCRCEEPFMPPQIHGLSSRY